MKFKRTEDWKKTWANDFRSICAELKNNSGLRLTTSAVLTRMCRLENPDEMNKELVDIFAKNRTWRTYTEGELMKEPKVLKQILEAYKVKIPIEEIEKQTGVGKATLESFILSKYYTAWVNRVQKGMSPEDLAKLFHMSEKTMETQLKKYDLMSQFCEKYQNHLMQTVVNKIDEIEKQLYSQQATGELKIDPQNITDLLRDKYSDPEQYIRLMMYASPAKLQNIDSWLEVLISGRELEYATKEAMRRSGYSQSLNAEIESDGEKTQVEDMVADPKNDIERVERLRELIAQYEDFWHSGRFPKSKEQANVLIQNYHDSVAEYENLTGRRYETDPEIETWQSAAIIPHILNNIDYPLNSPSHRNLKNLGGLYSVQSPQVKNRIRHPEDITNPYGSARDEQGNIIGKPNEDAVFAEMIVHNLLEVTGMYQQSRARAEDIDTSERDENKTVKKQYINWQNRMIQSVESNNAITNKDYYESEIQNITLEKFLLMFNEFQGRGFLLGAADYERVNNSRFHTDGQPKSWHDFVPEDEEEMSKKLHESYYPEGSSRKFRAYRQIPGSSLGYRSTSINVPEEEKQQVIKEILQNALKRGRGVRDYNDKKIGGTSDIPSGRYELPYDHPYFAYTAKPTRRKVVPQPELEPLPENSNGVLANILRKMVKMAEIIESQGYLNEAEQLDRIVEQYV